MDNLTCKERIIKNIKKNLKGSEDHKHCRICIIIYYIGSIVADHPQEIFRWGNGLVWIHEPIYSNPGGIRNISITFLQRNDLFPNRKLQLLFDQEAARYDMVETSKSDELDDINFIWIGLTEGGVRSCLKLCWPVLSSWARNTSIEITSAGLRSHVACQQDGRWNI